MTEQELVELEIERRAFIAVILAFTKSNIDIRMNVEMDQFLRSIENKVRDIQQVIAQNV